MIEENDKIRLNVAEIQSRFDRVQFAERLIQQLPASHEGRNTWLMNYGICQNAHQLRQMMGIEWDEATQSAKTIPDSKSLDASFVEFLDKVSSIVEQWPKWKQQILDRQK